MTSSHNTRTNLGLHDLISDLRRLNGFDAGDIDRAEAIGNLMEQYLDGLEENGVRLTFGADMLMGTKVSFVRPPAE